MNRKSPRSAYRKSVLFPLLAMIFYSNVALALEVDSLRWWYSFSEGHLSSIVDYGIENNRNLQASKKRTDQALQQAKLTRSLLFPSLYANGSWQGGDLNGSPLEGTVDPNMTNVASLSLDARYDFSSLGEELKQFQATKLSYLAQAEDHKDSELSASLQIAKLYFDAVYSKGQIRILELQKETAEQLLELTKMRYDKGQSSGLALLQQRQQLASVDASIPPANLQYQNSIEYLAAVTFLTIDTLATLIPDTLPYLPKAIDSIYSIEKRPDLAAAAYREEAAKANFSKAKLAIVPKFEVTGSFGGDYNKPGTDQLENMWRVGAQVSVPLFTGGAIPAGYREGKYGYESATALHEQAWQDARAQLTNALTEERSYRTQLTAYTSQYEASTDVYNESLRQYRNGLAEYLEVLTSINALQQTEITLLLSTRNLLQARLNIVKAIGGYLPSSGAIAEEK